MVFTFLVGRARSPETGALSSPDARPNGIQRHSLDPQSIPLFIFSDNSDGIEGLGTDLDGDLRVRYQIAIPVRVSGCASGGGEHDQAVALGHISHWSRATLSALGPSSREQEQGCAFPHSTNFAPMCSELLNQAAIVVVHLSSGPSCSRCRPRRPSTRYASL